MKLVAILGSPHGMKGSTGQLLEGVRHAAQSAGAAVTTFCLGDLEVAPCRACDVCHKTGKCGIDDDFQVVEKAMKDSDGIILASPNYILNVTAQLKALMDRCCGPLHLGLMKGKYGAAVVTSGGGGNEEIEAYLLRFLRIMQCWSVGSVGALAWEMADENAKGKRLGEADELGKAIAEAVRSKKTFPEQEAEQAEFRQRMEQLVTMRKDDWTYEYEYLKSSGRVRSE